MAQNLIACDRDQQLLLPPDMREWLPEDHLAWFVLEAVEQLDLGAFYACYRDDGQGAAAHDPAMMVALLLYAYAVGETSTRSIERRAVEEVAFRVIVANQRPDHTTISRFRARHADSLAGLFSQILALCERAGLVRCGPFALDGTKLRANASLAANRTPEQIRAEVEAWLDQVERTDRREDELYGDSRGDELPPQLRDRASRREALRRAKAELDAERAAREAEHAELVRRREEHIELTGRRPPGRPPGPRPRKRRGNERRNLTDPESRVVRDKGALVQGYNAQAIVSEGQIIVAAELTNEANDTRLLEPMVDTAKERLGPAPTVIADNGYWNAAQIAALHRQGIEAIVSPRGTRPRATRQRKQGPEAERIDRLLETSAGAALYRRRKQIVEPVFAQIKHLRGLSRLSRRGLAACGAEWKLIAATHNLLKLYRAPQAA
jgi:transposase